MADAQEYQAERRGRNGSRLSEGSQGSMAAPVCLIAYPSSPWHKVDICCPLLLPKYAEDLAATRGCHESSGLHPNWGRSNLCGTVSICGLEYCGQGAGSKLSYFYLSPLHCVGAWKGCGSEGILREGELMFFSKDTTKWACLSFIKDLWNPYYDNTVLQVLRIGLPFQNWGCSWGTKYTCIKLFRYM